MLTTTQLLPFSRTGVNRAVTFGAGKTGASLFLTYRIENLTVDRPTAVADFQRADALWKHTCLEVFLGTSDDDEYWELNFAADGRWNGYRFEGYRRGMEQEEEAKLSSFEARQDGVHAVFTIEVRLPPSLTEKRELLCNPAVIIENDLGVTPVFEYLAATHPGVRPDFHLKSARTVRIEESAIPA